MTLLDDTRELDMVRITVVDVVLRNLASCGPPHVSGGDMLEEAAEMTDGVWLADEERVQSEAEHPAIPIKARLPVEPIELSDVLVGELAGATRVARRGEHR